ncbi:tyrosine-type recombinase/integrase [Roseovarius pacificus]|uniref:tyrosine-type recombinase/integrase n=1 Tax=Roseovarius pacificus TaxID=337701 RepID=UPI00227AF562|nr:tyrosine-type recombinase/integrase [Roseovarius pacificus]
MEGKTVGRLSEAAELKVQDLSLAARRGGHDLATLHGKGGKIRQCPLWPETERALAHEIRDREGDTPVFVSRLGAGFTRFGVYRLIERCAAHVPALAGRTITPDVIRHTTVCHLVLARVDINTIRAWLGVALPFNRLCLNLCGGTVAFSPATILDRLDRTWRV